jgi:hypothetical protein
MNLVVKALELEVGAGGTRAELIGVLEKRDFRQHGVWIVLCHAWSHKVILHKRDRIDELPIHFRDPSLPPSLQTP